ncbi:MAG: hypothetical protein PHH36_01255 [Sideroxydans sp.]|nr:hypothetical protein [Sideroxydans sp.]
MLLAVILFTPVLLIFSADAAKAYLAYLLSFLPGLWLFILSNKISKPMKAHSDIGHIFFWVLVTGYIWLAKVILFPAAVAFIDHVFA